MAAPLRTAIAAGDERARSHATLFSSAGKTKTPSKRAHPKAKRRGAGHDRHDAENDGKTHEWLPRMAADADEHDECPQPFERAEHEADLNEPSRPGAADEHEGDQRKRRQQKHTVAGPQEMRSQHESR
jgi:hypothetical protein